MGMEFRDVSHILRDSEVGILKTLPPEAKLVDNLFLAALQPYKSLCPRK